MIKNELFAAAFLLAVSLPATGYAQGVARGAAEGAAAGNSAAGPVGGAVGGLVGGVAGGVTGAVGGILGIDQRPRFREHVVRESRPSYTYREEVRVGAELPSSGVTYYEVPAEYGVRDYRYTVVNNRPVLVDPRTHRIVEVIE
jgi:hypothetical protein